MSRDWMQPGLRARFAAKVLRLLQEDDRVFPMGFGLTPVAAGANVIIPAGVQVNARPVRLLIPESIAPSFLIHDFRIGMRSQFVAAGAVPAAAFSPSAVGATFKLDTLNVGQLASLDVSNIMPVPIARTVTAPPVALETLPYQGKKESKRAFSARYQACFERNRQVMRARDELHFKRQQIAEREHIEALAATRRNFTAALFCIPLETGSSDASWHMRRLAIKVLERIARAG